MYKLLKNLIQGILIFVLLFGFSKTSIYAYDCSIPTEPDIDPICGAFSGPPVVDENIAAAENTLIKFKVKFVDTFTFANFSKILVAGDGNTLLPCSNNSIRINTLGNGVEISTYCDFSDYVGEVVNIKLIYCATQLCQPANRRVLADMDYPPVNEGNLGKRFVMNSLTPRCNASGDWVQRFSVIDTKSGLARNQSLLLVRVDTDANGNETPTTIQDLIASNVCTNVTLGKPITDSAFDLLGEIECKIPHTTMASLTSEYEIRLYTKKNFSEQLAFESSRINISDDGGFARLNSANQVQGKREVAYRYDIRESAGANYIFEIVDNKNTLLQSCGSKTGNSCESNLSGSCVTNSLPTGHEYYLVMKRNGNPSMSPAFSEVNRISFRYDLPVSLPSDTCTCIANNCSPATFPPETNYCVHGKTPTASPCVPASSGLPSCTCKCIGSPTIIEDAIPDVQGYVRQPIYNIDTFKDFIGWIHNLLIAIGVVAAVFIFPYTLVLMASGSPENINKGKEWLYSLLVGLGVLILSGTIIRLFGNVLSL